MDPVPVIRTENLTKTYRLGVRRKPVEAVKGLNLTVFKREIFAFIGLNGAGKTTTIKLLLDHVSPTSGSAKIFNIDTGNPNARQKVGYLPDLPHFYRFLTAAELLDYSGRLFGLPKQIRTLRTQKLFKLVGLEKRDSEPLKGFSRGMLQRVGLAQALINNPELIILDEPLSGLDPIGRYEFREIISNLQHEGCTVFFSSHILDDAQKIADRIGIIHNGRLVAAGSLEDLISNTSAWEVEIKPEARVDLDNWITENNIEAGIGDNRTTLYLKRAENLRTIYKWAGDRQLEIISVNKRQVSLEEAFLKELKRTPD